MPIPADQIDPDARKVIRRLVAYEHQAYLVGGCVRDLLLERSPKDFDIATSATPNEVKALFRNCRIIGRRFRLAHIFFGPKIIETATFRANPREADVGDDGEEPEAGDLLIRRDNVFGNAEEDARRRDFTINGLFYDIEADQVIDYVSGLRDLAGRTVRTIGDPEIRFREDPVRILRAIKFAARLDFDIDPATYQAILTHQVEIPKCAPPRVLEEIYRVMRGGAARRSMELLRDTGVLALLVPELGALFTDRPHSEEAARLWRLLDRIDATKATGTSNAVLLCALAGPLIGPALLDEGDSKSRDVGQLVDDKAHLLFDQMRASRRDVERARQILLTLRRLAPSKKRRGKPMALVRRDWFEEALQVYELLAHSMRPTAPPEEEIDRWRKLLADGEPGQVATAVPGIPGTEGAVVAASGEGPSDSLRKRRRRRRGGRRGRNESDGPSLVDIDGDVELDDDDALADEPQLLADAATHNGTPASSESATPHQLEAPLPLEAPEGTESPPGIEAPSSAETAPAAPAVAASDKAD